MIKSSQQTRFSLTIKSALMLLLVFISNGLAMIFQKHFALNYPEGNIALFNFAAFFINAVLFYLIIGSYILKKKQMPTPLGKPLMIYGALFSISVFTIGQLITLCARTVSSAILFTVSGGISLIVAILVGTLIFKEKLTVNSFIGLIISLAAIAVLSFF